MNENKKLKCPFCGKSYQTERTLKAHITKQHKDEVAQTDTTLNTLPETELSSQKKSERKHFSDSDTVLVRNGTQGILHFRGGKTGFIYTFNKFGDELEVEFGDLKTRKSGNGIKFFSNNWLLIDDEDVLEQLNIKQFYDKSLSYDDFENIFTLSADVIQGTIDKLNESQKTIVTCLAVEKFKNREITDITVIDALEDALGQELYDR